MSQVPAYKLSRLGPEGHRVGEIARPHAVVLTPPSQAPGADRVIDERGINLAIEILTRWLVYREIVGCLEALEVGVPLLKHEGNPADFGLNQDQLQPRMARKYAVEDELVECVGDLHQL